MRYAEYNVQKYNVLYIHRKRIKIDDDANFILRMCLDFMISDGHVNVMLLCDGH